MGIADADILKAALNHAKKGLPVFPCKLDKSPWTKNGLKDASTNPEQIRKWWKERPAASIGCRMGKQAGVWALDVDLPDGPGSLAALEAKHGPLPATAEQCTGSGGRHLFFKFPVRREVRSSTTKLPPDLHVRGEGGYVILPPSGHPSGGTYNWVHRDSPALAPEWLLDLVAPLPKVTTIPASDPVALSTRTSGTKGYGRAALEKECSIMASTQEGGRNDQLNRSAFALWQLVAGGELDRHEAEAALIDAATRSGLLEREVRKTLASGMKAGESKPRSAPETRSLAAQGSIETVAPAPDDEWTPSVEAWPTLSPDALPGLVGTFVDLATRNSEADPAAVLATFLVRFGAELDSPFFMVGDTPHKPRLFAAIVGASSKARKGTSGAPVMKLFTFDEQSGYVPASCSPGPLSTGEGLVHAVRDEVLAWVMDKKTHTGEWVVSDPGVSDKRLFVLDEELAAALHCTKREGNTLSTAMRCFWDSGNVAPLTKKERTKTTNAHLALVTHITTQELASLLDNVQAFNGFGNRFLWVCARRRGLVAFPNPMPEAELDAIRQELLNLLTIGKKTKRIVMDKGACELWAEVYPNLSQEHPGLAGCIVNRGEAQVMRLAMLYTLLDGQQVICDRHLTSALAFWKYCHESAMLIFGKHETDAVVDKVLSALQGGPQSMTDLHKVMGNNQDKERIKASLDKLVKSGRVRFFTEPTLGRPKTIFSLNENNELNELSPCTTDAGTVISFNSFNSYGKESETEAVLVIPPTSVLSMPLPDRVEV